MRRTPKKLAALLGLVSTAAARPLGAEETDLLTKALTDYDQQRRQLGSILAKNLPAEIARYEEIQGEMNEKAIDDARRIATLEKQLKALHDSCPGVELKPNPCRCPCYGCKHNCGAHNPALDEEGEFS